MAHVTIVDDAEHLAAAAARRITTLIEAATSVRQRAALCLTGGRTPERLYQLLADDTQPWRARIDWNRVHVYWGDERHVPPDHPDSNFGLAYRTLLSHVPIPPDHVHRIHGERADPHDAAREYEAELVRFDLILLGVGEDAHIASIFPGSPLLDGCRAGLPPPPRLRRTAEASREGGDGPTPRVAALWVEHLHAWRLTLTPPAILDSDAIMVMAAGGRKADAVRAALVGPDDVSRCPAQLVRDAEWLIDRLAARSLDAPPAQ